MKSIALLSVLLGLAAAGPLKQRQELDPDSYFDAVGDAAPTATAPVGDSAPELSGSYDPDAVGAAAAAAVTEAASETAAVVSVEPGPTGGVEKREPVATCETRTFNGPRVTAPADTPEAFLAYAAFHTSARNAAKAASIPKGYALVPGFIDLSASVKGGDYLTYTSSKLAGYDLQTCADLCDNKVNGCVAFNICKYHKRDPANPILGTVTEHGVLVYERVPLIIDLKTHTTNKSTCPGLTTSPSATLIKCDFYGKPVFSGQATNTGQSQQDFRFVKAGSNAYVKSSAPTIDGYDGPRNFGNAAVNAPAPVGAHGFVRSQTFGSNVPYDPSLCAAACDASAAFNVKSGRAPCVFFDAFIQYLNGANGVMTCNLYSVAYDESYATNVGRRDNSGNRWTIAMSFGYTRAAALL
jgi:hypothetical protein